MKTIDVRPFVFALILFTGMGLGIKAEAQTVYITKTGEKYHKGTCRYLSKSKLAISYADALKNGYTACKVCKPSVKSSSVQHAVPATSSHTTTKKTSVSERCSAKTKSGTRCKRTTTHSSGKCWQHQ